MKELQRFAWSAPLFTDWSAQYVTLRLAGVKPGTPLTVCIDGAPVKVQYTGATSEEGAEILFKLGFNNGQKRTLVIHEADSADMAEGSLQRAIVSLQGGACIGEPGRQIEIGETVPFAGFAGRAMSSSIHCETALEHVALARINDGPLFTDYELEYHYAEERRYRLVFRCFKADPFIEVQESFSLRMNAECLWTLNPEKTFTHIISRDSFEGETQPTVEPLGAEHPRDVLCRLQMPVLSEYFIPNNRGWFAFFDERNEAAGMIGMLGLYGAKWQEPVENMPELFDRNGTVEWHASLASGKRYWLLYAGPVEKGFAETAEGSLTSPTGLTSPTRPTDRSDPRFVFHRLHGEFNALRLDEHLDLGGDALFDASCADVPGVFAQGDFHSAAQNRVAAYPCLQAVLPSPDAWLTENGGLHLDSFRYLIEPSPELAAMLYNHLISRFDRWVRQFQGYRTATNDYGKNVIGFSRYLRGMLLAHEQLRRDGALNEEQIRRLNAYFVFAARRMLDEGRWPHSRTWKHPDHPESSRDFYTYGGEHKPDRLVWTNSLPNFQSDPMCALAHLSAMFKDHPDAGFWLRFALEDIERQLDAYCGKSGAWQESINYALYTLSYMIITFKAVKERWGIDYFNDERVRRFVGWLCRFAGPRDKRFGFYTMPGVGNAVLPQLGQEYMLCYASELADGDPLKYDCLALWGVGEEYARLSEHYPVVTAAMAPVAEEKPSTMPLRRRESECMDEVGVAMRYRHTQADESYLFQKIGFAKDHYEADETAFHWYAKGVPLCMDYGTYTSDVGGGGAHNLVQIPDEDNLRRGYLAGHLFSPVVDYTHCELPVTLKLLWGKVRTFAEIEGVDGKIDRTKTRYFYIGDKNPVGPKSWKVRMMFFVKPDYIVLFDRVYGQVPHRYNLHVTGTDITRDGSCISATGRFDLDLLACVQHPAAFEMETGELIPNLRSSRNPQEEAMKHAQRYFRLYNKHDGIYRTLLFARERGRDVRITPLAPGGFRVETPEYTDEVYLHNDVITSSGFTGRSGWIRRDAEGNVQACVPDGESIAAFGTKLAGRGPWTVDASGQIALHGGPPRSISRSEIER